MIEVLCVLVSVNSAVLIWLCCERDRLLRLIRAIERHVRGTP